MKRHYLDHNAPVCEGAQTKPGRPSAFCYLDAGETIK